MLCKRYSCFQELLLANICLSEAERSSVVILGGFGKVKVNILVVLVCFTSKQLPLRPKRWEARERNDKKKRRKTSEEEVTMGEWMLKRLA